MIDNHLLRYKHECYDDLSFRTREITDQLQLFHYYDADNGLYSMIEDHLILQTMNAYTKYIEDCQTFREVTLLYNILLDQIAPIAYEMNSFQKELEKKQRQFARRI